MCTIPLVKLSNFRKRKNTHHTPSHACYLHHMCVEDLLKGPVCQLWGVITFEWVISLCWNFQDNLSHIYLSSGKVSSKSEMSHVPTFETLVYLIWNDPILSSFCLSRFYLRNNLLKVSYSLRQQQKSSLLLVGCNFYFQVFYGSSFLANSLCYYLSFFVDAEEKLFLFCFLSQKFIYVCLIFGNDTTST